MIDEKLLMLTKSFYCFKKDLHMTALSNSGKIGVCVGATKEGFGSKEELDHFAKILIQEKLTNLYENTCTKLSPDV